MKTTTTIRERIAVRAYYAWQNGSTASADTNWLEAEAIELAYAERRAATARKAAETRKVNAMLAVPKGAKPALVAPILTIATTRRPSVRRAAAH